MNVVTRLREFTERYRTLRYWGMFFLNLHDIFLEGIDLFFNKEVRCENCGVVSLKKNMGVYDTIRATRQGKNKDGKRIHLCSNCLHDSLFDLLSHYNSKAVIIKPSKQIKKLNAYVFYGFEESDDDLTMDMKELLPPENRKCNSCNDLALFTWVSLDVFRKNNPYNFTVNREIENYEFLCNECLVSAFKAKIEQEEIHIEAVLPPINEGEGFFTPWNY